jgi:hypothetical protein
MGWESFRKSASLLMARSSKHCQLPLGPAARPTLAHPPPVQARPCASLGN